MMTSRNDILALSVEDVEFAKFIKENGPLPGFDVVNYEALREAIKNVEARIVQKLGPLEPKLQEFEIEITLPDGWRSRAIVTRPSSEATPGPLIVLYYGGGFIVAGPEQNVPYARGFARLFGATVVMPSFRHAPEHPFPAGPDDAWNTLKWIATNAESDLLRACPAKGFIVGGISSGANFAAVLSRRALEEDLQPPLTGQWVSLLVGFRAHTVPPKYSQLWMSWDQNADAMAIDKMTGERLFKHYKVDFEHPMFCPLAPLPDGRPYLPPKNTAAAFIQCAGTDLIRDDGIVYHHALHDAGAKSRLAVYPGVPHSWWHAAPALDSSKKMLVEIAKGFGWLLDMQVDEAEVPRKLWLPTG